jgi:hypothetical protein
MASKGLPSAQKEATELQPSGKLEKLDVLDSCSAPPAAVRVRLERRVGSERHLSFFQLRG